MKLIKKTIDINAHVQNITYQISTDADISVAIIGFDNLGFGTVTAIKFEAKGYNAFGDIVQINGKEKFFLIIQDILIEKNGQARNLKVILPDPYIKKLELVEAQICYSDGDVISYEGENLKEFEIVEYDEYGSEKDIVDALRDRFGINFKYKPIECLDGWICGCGRFNKSKIKCSGCGNLKEDLFKYTSESEIEKMIPLFKETSEKHVEADKQGTERKEKKKKNIFIGSCIIVAIILACVIIHTVGGISYSSETDMRKSVAGTYTHYNAASGKADRQLVISGNVVTTIWDRGSNIDSKVQEWDYKNKIFKTFKTYTVLSNGDIKDSDGSVFKKGGNMDTPPLKPTSNYSYEKGESVLKIQSVKVTSNSSYTICTGTIKNIGTKTYRYIKVKGAFKDSSGNVIDTDWTYAVGAEGLEPNESSTFRLSVDKNSKIIDCNVSLLDYDF